MSTVRVYNRNTHPYKENFRDEIIEIKPGEFVTMDEKKAILFLGTYSQVKKTPQGVPDPSCFKKLEIVKGEVTAKTVEPEKFICQMDGTEHASKEALEAYINENHLDNLRDQKFAEERRKKK